jgi:hypothetical protein
LRSFLFENYAGTITNKERSSSIGVNDPTAFYGADVLWGRRTSEPAETIAFAVTVNSS